jgi:hypothetical protein
MAQAMESIEAVIISGARKGQIIAVPEREPELTPHEESLLNAVVADAQQLVKSLRAVTDEAEALLKELRQAKGK